MNFRNISAGPNNKVINRVAFKFGQSDLARTFLSLRDADDESRWDIPEDLVTKDKENNVDRLSQSNF